MIDTIKSKLAKIEIAISNAKEEADYETASYYIGQKDLCNSLLQEEQSNLYITEASEFYDYYEDEYYMSHYDESYAVDELQLHLDELKWYKQQEIDEMYNKYNHFSWWIPRKILSVDNLWFTSDEIEAFRVIWQRRISAM